MLDNLFKNIDVKYQGFIALIIGLLVLFGSLGRLGILQAFFHTIMIIAGLSLLLWGLDKSDLLKNLKNLSK